MNQTLRTFSSLLLVLAGSSILAGASPTAPFPSPAPSAAAAGAAAATRTVTASQYWIGVAVESIPPTVGKLLKLPPGQGLLIAQVIPGSPAEKAQLHAGDLLIELNQAPLNSQQQLVEAVNHAAGQRDGNAQIQPVSLGFIREDEHLIATLTPAPCPPGIHLGKSAGLPLDSNLRVGPGFIIQLDAPKPGESANISMQNIRSILSKGKTVILSQETDSLGHVRNSVTVGDKTYDLDPSNIESLPPEIRDLVMPLLEQSRPQQPGKVPAALSPSHVPNAGAMEEQIRSQNQKIDELMRKIDALTQQLNQQHPIPQPETSPRP